MFKMIIKEIKMKGFGNHTKEVSYSFNDDFTTLIGNNGTGKTTIANAITWCLVNANYIGKEKVTKSLLNHYSQVVEVSILADVIINGDKTSSIEFKRISGGGQITDGFFINNKKTTSQYLLKKLAINKEIFFSLINPLYFSSLNKQDAKNTILKVVKKIEDEEVFNNLDQFQQQALLENGFQNNINVFILETKDKIKHLKEDNIYFQGMLDAKNEKIDIPPENIDEINMASEKLLEEIKTLEKQLKKEYSNDLPSKKLLDENEANINNTKQQLATLLGQSKEQEIKRLKEEILNYKNYPLPKIPQQQNLQLLQQQLVSLRNKYKELLLQVKNIKDMTITCNNCGNHITLTNPQRQLLIKQMNEVKQSGINTSNNYKSIKQQNTTLMNEYEKELQILKQNIENEITKRNQQIVTLQQQNENPEITKIKEQIDILENNKRIIQEKLIKENQEKTVYIQKIEQKIKEKVQEKEQLDSKKINYNNLFTLEKKRKEEFRKTKELFKGNKEDLSNAKNVLDIAKIFISIKVKMQEAIFKKYLSNVELSLDKVVKSTGELKEDFSILYKGLEFDQISNSEKIKAGLELVNMFAQIKQIYLPIVIDNAESIVDYETTANCQTIELRVTKGAPLEKFA